MRAALNPAWKLPLTIERAGNKIVISSLLVSKRTPPMHMISAGINTWTRLGLEVMSSKPLTLFNATGWSASSFESFVTFADPLTKQQYSYVA